MKFTLGFYKKKFRSTVITYMDIAHMIKLSCVTKHNLFGVYVTFGKRLYDGRYTLVFGTFSRKHTSYYRIGLKSIGRRVNII